MKISTEIASTALFVGEEKAIELIAKAGFDAWDFSMSSMCRMNWDTGKQIKTSNPLSGANYLEFARKLKKVGLDNGIICNQSHAPFPNDCPEVRSYLKRAIECSAEAGAEICVIHPANNWGSEQNAEIYLELLPFAKECNVKIAAENMYLWDNEHDISLPGACSDAKSFNEHLDIVNDEFLVACLDIGHAEMRSSGGGAADMIRALGNRLQALHLHDNDRRHDLHQLPFNMFINFDEIIKALKEIDYKGYFTLEADRYLNTYNKDNFYDGVKLMAESTRKLADMFEKV